MNSLKNKKRVLVVDDDEDVREAICEVLALAGHETTGATDGTAALQLLRGEHCDLIVTDLRMPRMDGWQFLAALQLDAALRRIPVCVVSAEADAPVPTDRVIRKPFVISSLVELVARLLSRQCHQRCAA
jgi:CheY-like chemotaxis protein